MSDSDEGLTAFLNEQEGDSSFSVNGTEYTLVDTNNPVNWARVGTAITLSGIATISVIFQEFVNVWFGGIEDIIRGVTSWVGDVNPETDSGSGVLGELFVPLLRWYGKGLWDVSLEMFGIFGYLVAVAFWLATIGIVVIGFRRAGQRLAGGS